MFNNLTYLLFSRQRVVNPGRVYKGGNGKWMRKEFVNVPLELIHAKLNGESRRREIIPQSDSSAKKRIILIVRRALDLSWTLCSQIFWYTVLKINSLPLKQASEQQNRLTE